MKFAYWQCCLIMTGACIMICRSTESPVTSGPENVFPIGLGVSIAGAEFGSELEDFSNKNPGRLGQDYIFPNQSTIKPLADRGIQLMRIPIRWERLQPHLGQALDAAHLRRLDQTIKSVGQNGGRAIIDLHNYGRYCIAGPGGKKEMIIDQQVGDKVPVSREHLADFWRRMATHYAENLSVFAYGLMNEPHDMGSSRWQEISQESVDAIRAIDHGTWILVAGDEWSSSVRFEDVNGHDAWIDDETGRTAYEAHCYLDHDASGHYTFSYQEESQLDPLLINRPVDRLTPFANWCIRNGVHGFVGEFGVPVNDDGWNQLLEQMLLSMQKSHLAGCCWAAGPWWGDYPMSVEVNEAAEDSRSLQLMMQYR